MVYISCIALVAHARVPSCAPEEVRQGQKVNELVFRY